MRESEGQRLANEWADECVIAEAALAIDAALRRVKAEGLREAVLAMETYAVRSYAIAHVMASVAELERDARAAQIEEGE